MAYTSKAYRKPKEMREPVPGNGVALPVNEPHRVTIKNVAVRSHTADGEPIDNVNTIVVVFEDDFGNGHVERVFIFSRTEDDLGNILKQLLASIVVNSEELRDFYDRIIDHDWSIFSEFSGRRCVIRTGYHGEFVNIQTIRRYNLDTKDSGSFIQPSPTNSTSTSGTDNSRKRDGHVPLPAIARDFM